MTTITRRIITLNLEDMDATINKYGAIFDALLHLPVYSILEIARDGLFGEQGPIDIDAICMGFRDVEVNPRYSIQRSPSLQAFDDKQTLWCYNATDSYEQVCAIAPAGKFICFTQDRKTSRVTVTSTYSLSVLKTKLSEFEDKLMTEGILNDDVANLIDSASIDKKLAEFAPQSSPKLKNIATKLLTGSPDTVGVVEFAPGGSSTVNAFVEQVGEKNLTHEPAPEEIDSNRLTLLLLIDRLKQVVTDMDLDVLMAENGMAEIDDLLQTISEEHRGIVSLERHRKHEHHARTLRLKGTPDNDRIGTWDPHRITRHDSFPRERDRDRTRRPR